MTTQLDFWSRLLVASPVMPTNTGHDDRSNRCQLQDRSGSSAVMHRDRRRELIAQLAAMRREPYAYSELEFADAEQRLADLRSRPYEDLEGAR